MKDLMSYVPKKKKDAIKVIEKGFDGYEVVLNEGWLYADNNAQLICLTIAELKNDLRQVEYVGVGRFNEVTGVSVVAEDDSKDVSIVDVKEYVPETPKTPVTMIPFLIENVTFYTEDLAEAKQSLAVNVDILERLLVRLSKHIQGVSNENIKSLQKNIRGAETRIDDLNTRITLSTSALEGSEEMLANV